MLDNPKNAKKVSVCALLVTMSDDYVKLWKGRIPELVIFPMQNLCPSQETAGQNMVKQIDSRLAKKTDKTKYFLLMYSAYMLNIY